MLAGDRSQQHVLRIMKEVVEKLTAGEDPLQWRHGLGRKIGSFSSCRSGFPRFFFTDCFAHHLSPKEKKLWDSGLQSSCMSLVFLSLYLCCCLPFFLSSSPKYLCIYLCIHFFDLFIYIFIYLFIYSYIHLFIRIFIYLFTNSFTPMKFNKA